MSERHDDLSEKVAAVLVQHREDSTYPDSCLCEAAIPPRDSEGHYAAHLAAALLPLVDELRAAAWDEGWDERDSDCSELYSPPRANPYTGSEGE